MSDSSHTVELTPTAVPDGRTHEATDALEEAMRCAAACLACADTCLADGAPERLACIRACRDTAVVCTAAVHLLSPDQLGDTTIVVAVLGACVAACRTCASECNAHADHDEHCAACAGSCERCAAACELLLAQLSPQASS